MELFLKTINENHIRYRRDCTLAELSTFKVGGPVDWVFYPSTVEQCRILIRLAKSLRKSTIFLGNGSNILGSDKGCDEWIIRTDDLDTLEMKGDGIISVGAGVKLVKVSSFAAKAGYTGFEFAHGIPGSLGGAVFMNAGAYGGSMDQVVLRTFFLDENGELNSIEGEEHCFGYRESFFVHHPECLIVGAEIKLIPGDPNEISALISDLQQRRREKQPLEYPSAGSTFKRPVGYFAGKLIQDSDLKGYRIGDAQVSEKHAGFVINRGNATCAEIMDLISYVKEKVLKDSGVELECEVRFVGKK